MIDLLRYDEQNRVADLNVVQGCLACGGSLEVRTTPHGTWSHCRGCHRLSRSQLAMTPRGLQLVHRVATA